jgi:hypothetical protein
MRRVDYRVGVRAARALADGDTAFLAVLDAARDFSPDAFASFARAHNLREWLTPLVDSAPARARLGKGFVAVLEERRAALPREKRALLELSQGIRTRYTEAGIPCLFFKGLLLAERFYGDAHRRHQYDVDLLVRPSDFEAALDALAPLDFDLSITANGKPVVRRLEKIQTRDPWRAPQGVTLRRGDGLKVDLHCRLKSRLFRGIDEAGVWADRQSVVVMGHTFETLSDDRTLAHLLVSICADLRRGASRAKHFLDLYLMLRALGSDVDWEEFLANRAREGLQRAAVTALAIFLTLWGCAGEFPELARALELRLHLVSLRGEREALALVTRPRRSRWNRLWFARLREEPSLGSMGLRLGLDVPRALWGTRSPGWAQTGIDAASIESQTSNE